MDRLLSEQDVFKIIDNLKANFTCYDSVTLDEVVSHIKAIPSAQDNDYVMIKRTTWEKIKKALDSVSARGC